ncbi:hypothetical protein BHE74_00038825 [Ensete ventricosum]|nr:hypothetical protein BHE74_00038825 [Ensete ventricosum]
MRGGTPIEFQGGRSPIEITPTLEFIRVLTLGIIAAFLLSRPIIFHSRPKQFPQLLRSSSNFTVISTTADYPLISS